MFRIPYCIIVALIVIASSGPRSFAQFPLPTTVQQPTFGVSIDADGVLTSAKYAEPGGRLFAERARLAFEERGREWVDGSDLRKVSLRRLDDEIRDRLDRGEELTDEIRNLAGLTRIQFVFIFPPTEDDLGDIILAGPAEGWIEDAAGRTVGIKSGQPTLLLDDWLVAMRLFGPDRPADTWVGCTIDPTEEGLRRMVEFQSTIPSVISDRHREPVRQRIVVGLGESLGNAQIRVFGLPATSHMAQVLIEADYRMKRIGIGLEPPPTRMATFLSASRSARQQVLQRWWFTPRTEQVRLSEDGRSLELLGGGARLLSEEYQISEGGRLTSTKSRPSRASQLYTAAFTNKYPEIAAREPVYAQLANMMDILVAAAFLRRQDALDEANWRPSVMLDADQLAVEELALPRATPCVANAVWKGSRLLAPAGGGVSIRPMDAFKQEHLLTDKQVQLDQQASSVRESLTKDGDSADWYWD